MVTIEKVHLESRKDVNRFVQFQYDLYKNCEQFCPPFRADIRLMLNKKKHPFYQHSDGEFFLAIKDGVVVGRIGVFINTLFNEYHGTKKGQFYFFDSINDQEVANSLFDAACDYCRRRGMVELVGPKGLSAFDGYGILYDGFEHHQMMTMMNYNYPYYPKLVEKIGFEKEVDFASCYIESDSFVLPEKIREVAKRVIERGKFQILEFKTKSDVRRMKEQIGAAYNDTFVNNWEYYPITRGEMDLLMSNLMDVINPRLIKLITYNEKIVGFLIAFPDITKALQRHNGRLTPFTIIDLLFSLKKTDWVSLNGAGVLPEYHGRGGNALLYYEMEKTLKDFGFTYWELTQVAESAVQMRKDLTMAGGEFYKTHRVYHKNL
jgi:GNAT superfamily N-acetyltransferase